MTASARICLNMIVKNESAIIERCLASVVPLIDHYVICDTGSTDDTPAKIIDFFSGRSIPGELHRTQFVDFEATRNQALELCRRSPGDFTYILLVDADMESVLEDSGLKQRLSAPAYRIRQSNRISYDNVRLIRRDLEARYMGVTHEYLETGMPAEKLEGMWFRDHACGSSRAIKFERDIALLEAGLQREPGNVRYMFYLAQSYKDCGRFAEASRWYEKRIAAGGWDEEAWYSRWMLAQCHLGLGRGDEFIRECLAAYDARPSRAEPLHGLAKYCRQKGMSEACMLLCEAGKTIPYPQQDSLFIDNYVYNAGFMEEESISGFYCSSPSRRQRGYEACLALATSRLAGETARRTAQQNSLHYVRSAAELFGACDLSALEIPLDPPYSPTNPSICSHDGTIYGVVRAVNYSVKNMVYRIHDEQGIIRSRNFFVRLDQSLAVADAREILECDPVAFRYDFPVAGFEDCRLFFYRGRFWCSATVRNMNANGRCEIALLELDADRRMVNVSVERTVHADRHQKNWVPLVRGEDLFYVYLSDPTTVLAYDFAEKRARVVSEKTPALALEHLRGGSQAIPVADGWLYLTHEVVTAGPTLRAYLHRFVWLTTDFEVRAVSDPFYFERKGLEFCAGLVIDEVTGRLIASVGLGDCRACIAQLPLDPVLSHLRLRSSAGPS
ncbi:MAG: glycosyltransferase, partial [Acidobacteriota bacterium]|nr:glycosyltransferase [Acidobacteriota bacterium]